MSAELLGIVILGLAGLGSFLCALWIGVKGERHISESVRMVALEQLRDRDESRRFWEKADRRWADHELLMRMTLERVDRNKGES